MVAQLYQKYTLPTNLLDARLNGEFANLYSYIGGTLLIPIAIGSGGTNSSTALNNNRVMKSASGSIVEASVITAARALISDANGIPTQSAVTSTELGFSSGVTSALQTQLNAKQATGSYVTGLTGDVTATGPGSVAATLATVNASPGSTTISSVTTNGKGLVTANTSASTTGSGNVVLATSPTLAMPLLGTPTSGILTNCTGTASGLTAGTVTTNANLTGPITSSGNATSIASQTGTGTKFVVDTSPVLITPTLGAATATSITFSPTTSGIVGTPTNDNASAGKVGEIISASVVRSSAITVTSGATLNVVSISLTAGDWDVQATITIEPSGTTVVTNFTPAISTTSITLPGADTIGVPDSTGQIRMDINYPAGYVPTSVISQGIPSTRVSLSGTVTYFLVLRSNFSISAETVYGSLFARRMR